MTMILLFPKDHAAPGPGTLVLKAGEYGVMAEAGEVLASARREADRVAEEAREAYGERRREGYEKGLAEGKAEVADQLMETLTASVEHMASMEASLVDVVMRSLRTILGTFDDADLAGRVVAQALRMVIDEKRVRLRVASADAPAVEARLEDIRQRHPGDLRVDLVPDVSLARGGCVLETELGVIDASIDRQLAIIEETFRRHLEERRV